MGLRQLIGDAAERRAERFLVSQGLIAIAQNFRTKRGELDLVMRDGDYWVCIEVKYREQADFGYAVEMVTPRKLQRIKAAFEQFLLDNGLNPAMTPQRVDIVAIDGNNLEWLQNVTA